jgi:FAD/FMN-containing dehydrogenase
METLGFDDVVLALRSDLSGEVLAAGDPGYEAAAKVWNGMYDERRPVAVLRPEGEEDVRRAVARLADVEAPLAVRGGGHHIAGFGGCDGGFVIDLAAMRGAGVDAEGRRIRVSTPRAPSSG